MNRIHTKNSNHFLLLNSFGIFVYLYGIFVVICTGLFGGTPNFKGKKVPCRDSFGVYLEFFMIA
jgi:hypothetical protein